MAERDVAEVSAEPKAEGLLGVSVQRLVASAAGSVLAGLGAALLDARYARAAEAEPVGMSPLWLADAGVIWPVALGVGVLVGIASVVLHPGDPPSIAGMLRALRRGDDNERGERGALALLGPLATVAWTVIAARVGLDFLASELEPKPAATAGVLGALLAALALALATLGAARGLGRLARRIDPALMLGVGVALALGLFTYAVVTGTTSGDGGTLAIFGVLKRAELDLRAPGLLLGIAAVAYLAPALLARIPAWLLVVLSLLPAGLTLHSARSGLAEHKLGLATERDAPLGKLALARLRKLSDRDKDGFSSLFGGGDCNDHDPKLNPGAEDIPGNDIDEDCTGSDAKEVTIEKTEPEVPKDARKWALDKLPAKPNLVLITIDTLRWDLGYMGNPRPLSPNLDALAKESVVFEHNYALASYTSKSLPPALIGKYPSETHMGWAHFNRFEKSDTFIAERLQKAGVRTISVQGYWYFTQEGVGFERGFDVIDASAGPKVVAVEGDKSSNSDRLSDAAIAQLAKPENTSKQFFLWVHYVDPHAEYAKHDGFDFGPSSRDRYDGEVAFVDQHVGRLIKAIEAASYAKNTVIMVTSDHGEAFGEHGLIRHGFEVWEELIRVPFIVRVPGLEPRRVSVRRSAIDLVPTILDLFRLPPPSGEGTDFVSGTSLLPDLTAPPGYTPKQRIIISHMAAGPNNADRMAFIDGSQKLITSDGRPMGLYDLDADPGEKKDLLDDAAAREKITARQRAFLRELRQVKLRRE